MEIDPTKFLGDAAGGAVLAGVLAWFMAELRRVTDRLYTLLESATAAISESNTSNSETRAVLRDVSSVIAKCRKNDGGNDE